MDAECYSKRKARRAVSGECVECSRPAGPGITRCAKCSTRVNKAWKRIQQHTCHECGATYRGEECAFCGPVAEDSDGVMSLTDVFGG